MNLLESTLSAYDYKLPQRLIASAPAHPRDSAKLLIFDRHTQKTSFDTFRNITTYLPKNAILVLNETKVIPARFRLTKQTGGRIGALYVKTTGNAISVLAEGKLKPGDTLTWQEGHSFTVQKRNGKEAVLQPSFPIEELKNLLENFGETPLPPYIKDSPLSEHERRAEYQTVFAHAPGSVAAPTAGLHFTKELLEKMRAHGCAIHTITLHVNLGTFSPVTEEHLKTRSLHEEWYEIDPETARFLNDAKKESRPIIAVGTTVVRTLESACRPFDDAQGDTPQLTELKGVTTLFLSPENPPKFVDSLVTNFHVPKSSLLMLVAAFTGRETLFELYRQAIEKEFRFFSFGDGMLIL